MPEDAYDLDDICQHQRESKDCEAVCDYCKHGCGSHWMGDACEVDGCDCECFVDEVGEETED